MTKVATGALASERTVRMVAQAAATFEHLLMGRGPTGATVVAGQDWLVISLHEPFTAAERVQAADAAGARRLRQVHGAVFTRAFDPLRRHVEGNTGVVLRGAALHVDAANGSIVKTLSTHPTIDLFLLGRPHHLLGVPVNEHRRSAEPGGRGSGRE